MKNSDKYTFVDKLMCSTNELQVVGMHEFIGHRLTK